MTSNQGTERLQHLTDPQNPPAPTSHQVEMQAFYRTQAPALQGSLRIVFTISVFRPPPSGSSSGQPRKEPVAKPNRISLGLGVQI